MRLDSDMLDAMTRIRRAALVNSLSGFKSANLVGTAVALTGLDSHHRAIRLKRTACAKQGLPPRPLKRCRGSCLLHRVENRDQFAYFYLLSRDARESSFPV